MFTRRITFTIAVLLCCLVSVGTSFAGTIDPDTLTTIKTRFAAADKDKNGQLTREECEAGMPRIYRGFDQIDTEKKGYITLDQIITFVSAHE